MSGLHLEEDGKETQGTVIKGGGRRPAIRGHYRASFPEGTGRMKIVIQIDDCPPIPPETLTPYILAAIEKAIKDAHRHELQVRSLTKAIIAAHAEGTPAPRPGNDLD